MKNLTALFALVFTIAQLSFGQERPQEPKEPFDYNSENIEFTNAVDGG